MGPIKIFINVYNNVRNYISKGTENTDVINDSKASVKIENISVFDILRLSDRL